MLAYFLCLTKWPLNLVAWFETPELDCRRHRVSAHLIDFSWNCGCLAFFWKSAIHTEPLQILVLLSCSLSQLDLPQYSPLLQQELCIQNDWVLGAERAPALRSCWPQANFTASATVASLYSHCEQLLQCTDLGRARATWRQGVS